VPLLTPESVGFCRLICYLSARLRGSWQAEVGLFRLGGNPDDPACRTCRLDFLNGQDGSDISRSIQDERCGEATVLTAATALGLERIGGFDCEHGAPRLTERKQNIKQLLTKDFYSRWLACCVSRATRMDFSLRSAAGRPSKAASVAEIKR
jgi:hypothetical protein